MWNFIKNLLGLQPSLDEILYDLNRTLARVKAHADYQAEQKKQADADIAALLQRVNVLEHNSSRALALMHRANTVAANMAKFIDSPL